MVLEGEVRGWFECCEVVGLSECEFVGKNIHARVNYLLAWELELHVTAHD